MFKEKPSITVWVDVSLTEKESECFSPMPDLSGTPFGHIGNREIPMPDIRPIEIPLLDDMPRDPASFARYPFFAVGTDDDYKVYRRNTDGFLTILGQD